MTGESSSEIFIRDVANLLQQRQPATSLGHPIHRLLKLRKQIQDERQMWTCLTTTCKSNCNMLRIGHFSVLIWEQNFRRWLQSVDVTWNILNDNVFHKLVEEVETISPRRILRGTSSFEGFGEISSTNDSHHDRNGRRIIR